MDDIGTTCRDAWIAGEDIEEESNGFWDCDDYAFSDDLHPTTKLLEPMVEEAFLPAIKDHVPQGIRMNFRRLISFGDSISDLGSSKNTIDRSDERWAASQRVPPLSRGSFANKQNLVELLEMELDMSRSTPFIQASIFDDPKEPFQCSEDSEER